MRDKACVNYKAECDRLMEELQIRCKENDAVVNECRKLVEENDRLRFKLGVLQGFVSAVEIIFDGSLHKQLEDYGE